MEPERKIEKLLCAFGKRRRERATDAFKLHPANRRLLQGEVRKTYSAAKASQRPALFRMPRFLAVSGGITAVLLLLAIIIPGFPPTRSNSGRTSEVARETRSPALVPEQDSMATLSDHSLSSQKEKRATSFYLNSAREDTQGFTLMDRTEGAPAPGQAASASNGLWAEDSRRAVTNAKGLPARADFASSQAGRRFSRTAAETGVLSDFSIEQTRWGLRIIDADGSVYDSAQTDTASAAASSMTFGARRLFTNSPLAQFDHVTVSGTNLTLNQRIIFTGRLSYVPYSTNISEGPASGGAQPVASAAPLPTLPATLRGTVQLEGGRTIQIEATNRLDLNSGDK